MICLNLLYQNKQESASEPNEGVEGSGVAVQENADRSRTAADGKGAGASVFTTLLLHCSFNLLAFVCGGLQVSLVSRLKHVLIMIPS